MLCKPLKNLLTKNNNQTSIFKWGACNLPAKLILWYSNGFLCVTLLYIPNKSRGARTTSGPLSMYCFLSDKYLFIGFQWGRTIKYSLRATTVFKSASYFLQWLQFSLLHFWLEVITQNTFSHCKQMRWGFCKDKQKPFQNMTIGKALGEPAKHLLNKVKARHTATYQEHPKN